MVLCGLIFCYLGLLKSFPYFGEVSKRFAMRYVAQFFSMLFHPLLMPVYAFGLVFVFFPQLVFPIRPRMFGPLLGFIAVSTFVLPVVCIFLLYKAGVISKVGMVERKDRFVPHLITTLIYAATSYFFYAKLSPVPNAFLIIGSMTVCMALVAIMNLFWKVSAHATAMGGFTSFGNCFGDIWC